MTTVKVYVEDEEFFKALDNQEFVAWRSPSFKGSYEMYIDFNDIVRPYEYKGRTVGVFVKINKPIIFYPTVGVDENGDYRRGEPPTSPGQTEMGW